jgi:WD40 repeat protein
MSLCLTRLRLKTTRRIFGGSTLAKYDLYNGLVALSPDPSRLAAGYDQTVRVWDLRNVQSAPQVLSGHKGAVNSLAFSLDSQRLASASDDGTVRLWDLRQPQSTPQVLSGHKGWVDSVAFVADGNRLASAGRRNSPRMAFALECRRSPLRPPLAQSHQQSWGQVHSASRTIAPVLTEYRVIRELKHSNTTESPD